VIEKDAIIKRQARVEASNGNVVRAKDLDNRTTINKINKQPNSVV